MLDRLNQWLRNQDLICEFVVGTSEQHQVVFSWSQIWSMARLRVDGVQVLRRFDGFHFRTTRYQCLVGESEVHTVVIEITRVKEDLLFGIYMDGELVRQT